MAGKLILASQSPRRIELMRLITPDFEVRPSHFDEGGVTADTPAGLASALALGKARAAGALPEDIVIGCDTVVACGGRVFGKPKTRGEARRMLTALSGGVHSVVTGVCVLHRGGTERFTCETEVTFFPLREEEIEAYIRTDEPYDKAGGYGIQGRGGLFAERIDGDYYNVVGMPLSRLYRVLRQIREANPGEA